MYVISIASEFLGSLIGVDISEEGAESWSGSTEAETSSVTAVGSERTDTVSRFVGELADEAERGERGDFTRRCGVIFCGNYTEN